MSADWIPFHSSLRQGDKRGLPRAVRFVFLEISLTARPFRGVLPLPRGFKNDEAALHDILGGDIREIRQALRLLTLPQDPTDPEDAPMIELSGPPERRILTVPSFDLWVKADKSTPRVRKHRAKRKEQHPADASTGNAFQTVPETRFGNDLERDKRKERIGKEKITPNPVDDRGADQPTGERGALVPAARSVVVGVGATIEDVAIFYVETLSTLLGHIVSLPAWRSDRTPLEEACNTHLKSASIGELKERLRGALGLWVEAYRDRVDFTSGWHPKRFLAWLNTGAFASASARVVAASPLPPEEPAEPMTDEERRRLDAQIASLRGTEPARATAPAGALAGALAAPAAPVAAQVDPLPRAARAPSVGDLERAIEEHAAKRKAGGT